MAHCCDMRGYLTFLVLRLISKRNMSGEEIRKEIQKRKGQKPSPGTIYPVLKVLSENRLIEEIEESGKTKKYRITSAGETELDRATRIFVQTFYDLKDDFRRYGDD